LILPRSLSKITFYEFIKFDGLVKSWETPSFVIPAKETVSQLSSLFAFKHFK
jgi:hypothetical protein